jgi:hypothetical protein
MQRFTSSQVLNPKLACRALRMGIRNFILYHFYYQVLYQAMWVIIVLYHRLVWYRQCSLPIVKIKKRKIRICIIHFPLNQIIDSALGQTSTLHPIPHSRCDANIFFVIFFVLWINHKFSIPN